MEHWVNRVIAGDCLEVMEAMPPGLVDLVVCDLPYGTTRNPWDTPIDFSRLWLQYKRLLKPEGVIALTAAGLFTAQLIVSNPAMFRYKLVWVKSRATNFLNARRQPLRRHEDICIFHRGQGTYHPQKTPGLPYDKGFRTQTDSYGEYKAKRAVNQSGNRHPTDVIFFKVADKEGQSFFPTQKPVALGRYLVRTFSNEGDIVLDNACGSGSFLVAAVLEKRQYIGIEKYPANYSNKKYKGNLISICNKRISEAKGKRELFDGKD